MGSHPMLLQRGWSNPNRRSRRADKRIRDNIADDDRGPMPVRDSSDAVSLSLILDAPLCRRGVLGETEQGKLECRFRSSCRSHSERPRPNGNMPDNTAIEPIQIINDCSGELLSAVPRLTSEPSEESVGLSTVCMSWLKSFV